VRPGRERLTERPPPPADGEPVANGSGEAAEARRALVWRGEDQLAVDGVEFFVTADSTRYHAATSTPERFVLAKIPPMIERLARVIDELAPQRLAEIGIYKGGSAALLATLARPVRLTAIELQPTPVQALAQFVARRGLQDVVRPHYGVDQADGERLAEILDDDHGDRPLDLVIDDASHLYPETRASFEVLFARLRPGGVYIIEDWAWAHFPGPEWQEGGGPFGDRPALTNLIVELLMLAGRDSELISAIEVMRDTVTVRRGPAVVHGPLRLEAHYVNRGLSFRPLI
jgi:predicted O-methyltransferase YrrM